MYGCSIHYGKIINKMASKMLRTKQCTAQRSTANNKFEEREKKAQEISVK